MQRRGCHGAHRRATGTAWGTEQAKKRQRQHAKVAQFMVGLGGKGVREAFSGQLRIGGAMSARSWEAADGEERLCASW